MYDVRDIACLCVRPRPPAGRSGENLTEAIAVDINTHNPKP